MSSGEDQQSRAFAKPTFSELQACALVESVFGLKVSTIQPLPSYDDQNFHVCISRTKDTTDGLTEYVFKVSNTESSKTPDLIEVQTHIIMFLRAAGFPTASVCRTKGDDITSLVSVGRNIKNRLIVPRGDVVIFSVVGRSHSVTKAATGAVIQKWPEPGSGVTLLLRKDLADEIHPSVHLESGSQTKSYLVRLLTYLPGRPVAEVPVGHQLLYDIGRLAAKLDKTLEKFHHPKLSSLHRENFIWNLKNVPLLEKYLYALGQNRNRKIVEQVIQLFKDEVMTKLSHFRECINHGDLNDHNILIESSKSTFGDAEYQVSGILDFDDMSYGYYVFEVAITIMYMMIESKNPIQVGGHVLAGFESIIPLTPVERGALFLLVCSRFCQSLVIAAYSCQLHPENEEYLMITAKTGWKHLQQMFDMGRDAVEGIWFDTARHYASGIVTG